MRVVDVNGVSVNAITTVATPTSGRRLRLMRGWLSSSAAVFLLFEDNVGGVFVYRTPVLEVGKPYELILPLEGIALSVKDRVLKLTGAGATVTGSLIVQDDLH